MADRVPADRVPAPAPDLVVIGGSAGSVPVLLELAAGLPADFPAAVLVVLHVGANRSVLPELMRARGALAVRHAVDRHALQPGVIDVAPPDQHMLVEDGRIRLQRGPKENHARPAIDPLFRSAALARGPRTVGVLLSGRLDDGTAGLQAIKRCGGLAVVQDPDDAQQPEMPASALAHVDVDYCVPAAQLAGTLVRLVGERATHAAAPSRPGPFATEHAISVATDDAVDLLNDIGQPSRFACPECNGVLWEIEGARPRRYRCHAGHAYTLRSLAFTQDAATDGALQRAMRALQERQALLDTLLEAGERDGDGREGDALAAEAQRTRTHAEQLRRMIANG